MDRVHGFGSWVHDIADQSRPLILIRAARILLKWKGIGDLILTLHLWADGSYHIRPTGAAHRPGVAGQWGAHRSFAPELSGAWWRRVFGAKWCGVDGVLTRGEMQWGTAPRRLATVVSLLRARVTVSASTLFRLQEVAQRLPRGLLLLLGWFNGSNQWRLARIWWRLGFSGLQALWAKIWAMGHTIYRGFR
jgi:hypothetical protein